MITSFFKKSTPLNYAVIILGLLFVFFYYQMNHVVPHLGMWGLVLKVLLLAVLFASMFVTNFVVKKNGVSKDSAYAVLLLLLFCMFFPGVLDRPALLLSNWFILLAMRRIISLHSLKASKEKVFDASLWVFIATLFHFWSILYIVLIFIAILFHVARDYRNWFLPLLAGITIAVLFVLCSLYLNKQWISQLLADSEIDLKLDYFSNNKQNLSFTFYATLMLFFVLSLLFSLSNRPLILHPTYKKVISAVVIGVAVFVISPNKASELLVFTFAPLAMVATSYFETPMSYWKKEVILALTLIAACFSFFTQS